MKTTDKNETKTAEKKTTTTAKADDKKVNKDMVKAKSDAAGNLRELFIDSLKDIYWAEKALTKALPKMAANATTPKLIHGLTSHLEETHEQIKRLEEVFKMMGEKAVAKKCEAMDGLIKEGDEILEETQPGPVRDAGIIAASQKIEHYEIATYGTLCSFAKTLGEKEVGVILHKSLLEEKGADQNLSDAAYLSINFEATDK